MALPVNPSDLDLAQDETGSGCSSGSKVADNRASAGEYCGPAPQRPEVFEDIFIAVHGIGAQQRNATVRAVANRFATSTIFKEPRFSPQPLGYFHGGPDARARVQPLDGDKNKKHHYGFSEVFWAHIPRTAVDDKATLEEIKAWGRTVAARAQAIFFDAERSLARQMTDLPKKEDDADAERQVLNERYNHLVPPDFSLAAEVIDEIVDTIQVLENLSFLAEKAGLLKFDVREILEEYVGDVQIVAEFQFYRQHVIGRLHSTLQEIYEDQMKLRDESPADRGRPLRLHLVAHSEGTVVAFFGLLHALHGEVWAAEPDLRKEAQRTNGGKQPDWLGAIHGLMTLGSPIDKHLLLWRELTDPLRKPLPLRPAGRKPIQWRNYYDYGDPVGFNLDSARRFLDQCEDTNFNFCACPECRHDMGFARYVLPGKAHNDYWDDAAVFDHYIRSVVQNKPTLPQVIGKEQKWRDGWRNFRQTVLPLMLSHFKAPLPWAGPRSEAQKQAEDFAIPPLSRPVAYLLGPSLPYLFSALLLAVGTFILYKSITNFIHPEPNFLQRCAAFLTGNQEPEPAKGVTLLRHSLALAALLAGTTIAARLPRLALKMKLRAAVCWLLGSICYIWGLSAKAQQAIGSAFTGMAETEFGGLIVRTIYPKAPEAAAGTLGVLATSLGVVIIGYLASRPPSGSRRSSRTDSSGGGQAVPLPAVAARQRRWFRQGARPIMILGALAIVTLVWSQINDHGSQPPGWPVLLSGAVFLYLWLLSTLIFDLAFVWQRYIRGGAALKQLRIWRRLGRGVDPDAPEPPRHITEHS